MSDAVTGLGLLVRTFLRRDRWMILWFTVGVTLLYWSQAASVRGLYSTQAELDRAAASMGGNAAFVAMAGPPRALNTAGGQVTWQASAFGAIAVGLMAMFLIGRHTRAEEESGRDELVRSSVVGRQAPMTAALAVVVLACAVVGGGVAGSLVAYELPVAGAVANGLGVALCGIAFGTLALLAAQLTGSTRAAYGITGAVIGVSYVLRAIGDVGNGVLSWLSPIGWYQAMHAFSGERWWPAVLLLGLAVTLGAASYAVFARRDIGAGMWPPRPGPARASAALASGLGLAWRLQRPSLLGWSIGMFLGGLAYGSIGSDIESLMGDSAFARDVFGAGSGDVVDGFYAAAALMLVLIACGFPLSSALRPRSEELDGRVEPLLATALPRARWLLGHVLVTLLGTVLVAVLAGLGMGIGFAFVTGDTGRIAPFIGATTSLLPGVLLLAAIAGLLYGVQPLLAPLTWLVLVLCVVVMLFGDVLRLPEPVLWLSPFHHLSAYPAVPVAWSAFCIVLVLAVLVSGAGVLAFRRRDLR
ncbi:MAG TPA: ABC transporter permease [Marmoricola sp.]|jgi:ABC-2 type transport system permease protein|nr:ABC transporter permease [Marmoricola sp.]